MKSALKWIVPPAVSSFLITVFILIYLTVKNYNQNIETIIQSLIFIFPTFFGIFYIVSLFFLFLASQIIKKLYDSLFFTEQQIHFWIGFLGLLLALIGSFTNFYLQKDFLKSFLIFVSIVFGISFLISTYLEMKKNEKKSFIKN